MAEPPGSGDRGVAPGIDASGASATARTEGGVVELGQPGNGAAMETGRGGTGRTGGGKEGREIGDSQDKEVVGSR
jgi:hypothetical protein